MAECCALEELEHEAADSAGVQCSALAVGVHILFEVLFAVFKDENKFGFGMDDIVKTDNVHVFELFHERDFADGGRGRSLFCIEMDLFERNNLIGRPRASLSK